MIVPVIIYLSLILISSRQNYILRISDTYVHTYYTHTQKIAHTQ